MIHNNFRKLMRLFSRGSSSSKPWIKDFTDITGYTGVNDGQDYSTGERIFLNATYSNFTSITVVDYGVYYTWSAIQALNYSGANYYVLGGKSVTDEPDYTLGSVSNYLQICMTSTNQTSLYDYLITGVLKNNGTEPIIIDELALMTHLYYNNATAWHGQYRYADFLLIKEKLTTPITLEAGASISVTFKLFADEPTVTVEDA